MTYYIFGSHDDAAAAADAIVENVRKWAFMHSPEILSEDGERLRSRNAASGEIVNVYTDRWAEPQQTVGGQWVFEKPTSEKTAPIPLAVFVAGVTAEEAEYDPAWFASPY